MLNLLLEFFAGIAWIMAGSKVALLTYFLWRRSSCRSMNNGWELTYSELLMPPVTDYSMWITPSKVSDCVDCFVPVFCQASVSKLGSSCCPPSLCLVWLSAEWPCQGDILSHHVLTHLQPGLLKAFAAQFSGAEASRVLFYCINPSVSYFLVCCSYSPNGLTYTSIDSPLCQSTEKLGHFNNSHYPFLHGSRASYKREHRQIEWNTMTFYSYELFRQSSAGDIWYQPWFLVFLFLWNVCRFLLFAVCLPFYPH